jgi:hypothetical protein
LSARCVKLIIKKSMDADMVTRSGWISETEVDLRHEHAERIEGSLSPRCVSNNPMTEWRERKSMGGASWSERRRDSSKGEKGVLRKSDGAWSEEGNREIESEHEGRVTVTMVPRREEEQKRESVTVVTNRGEESRIEYATVVPRSGVKLEEKVDRAVGEKEQRTSRRKLEGRAQSRRRTRTNYATPSGEVQWSIETRKEY